MLDSYKKGTLYRSAKRGVISLIPKQGKDQLELASWRPLCLLNLDYKLLTKMLTNRLKTHLQEVIGTQQTGYVPGRFIGINLRKLIDMLLYIENEQIEAVLVCIDFHKCFDSIEHHALIQSLKYFGVGDYFISWVELLYKDFEFCVTNNGRFSNYYKQKRGVHQGSALSGPFFLYVAEILSNNIKNNQKIKGIPFGDSGERETISQYADDTNIWSLYEEESINEIIRELDDFFENTGLKVNFEKSVIFRVGAARNKKRLKLNKRFKWGESTIDTLGLIIELDNIQNCENCNYETIIEKAQNIIANWSLRSVSLTGKIQVVNSLINSLFVYKMQVLPLLSNQTQQKIVKMISEFIWNARKPKIRYETLCLAYEEGGRKLSNIVLRDQALKVEWIRCIVQCEDKTMAWLALYHLKCKIKNEIFWECNINIEYQQISDKIPVLGRRFKSLVPDKFS